METDLSDSNTLEVVFYIVLLIVLLGFSALISGAEIAFFSISKKQLDTQKKINTLQASQIITILKNKKEILSTLLIINTFLNIAIVLLCSLLSNKYLHLKKISIYGKVFSLQFLIEVIGITFCILLFGEIIPKIYARKKNFHFALFMYKPIFILNKLLKPFNYLIIKMYDIIDNKISRRSPTFSKDQLLEALFITKKNKKTDTKEDLFLESIIHFGNIEARQVMSPRVDIFALKYDMNFSDVLKIASLEGYSRIPVYKESIDDIEGILYIKDLLSFLNKKEDYQWTHLIHPPLFVSENKKINDLLSDFKTKKIHLAIVVDEYGGTSGLVTLEDVIEEIVGDISDEFDEKNLTFSKINQNTYLFEGKIPLIDFYRYMQIEEEALFEQNKGDADTLAGFIIEINKGFPSLKQKIRFLNYIFIIQGINEKRIHRIEVQRKNFKPLS